MTVQSDVVHGGGNDAVCFPTLSSVIQDTLSLEVDSGNVDGKRRRDSDPEQNSIIDFERPAKVSCVDMRTNNKDRAEGLHTLWFSAVQLYMARPVHSK